MFENSAKEDNLMDKMDDISFGMKHYTFNGSFKTTV